MYEYIVGKAMSTKNGLLVLETHNIGYSIKISDATADSIRGVSTDIKIYTYLHVREDVLDLYGFRTEAERSMFLLLLSVSKIGPKNALNILSHATIDVIVNWVLSEDSKSLSTLPGIGLKTAKRVILELKTKLQKERPDWNDMGNAVTGLKEYSIAEEAVAALETLGLSRAEGLARVMDIIKNNPEIKETQILIKRALKHGH
jgi:holliday junction DNA helicase RuvA